MGNTKEGGDTYYGPKLIFETEQRLRDIQNRFQAMQKPGLGFAVKCLRIPFWMFRRLTHRYFFGTGNWYRNDTIWRAILDINRIIVYADKQGNLTDTPQRSFFSLGNMIVSGHKNGPLAPSPVHTGVLLCSEDPVAFDMAVIRLMGLDYGKLPVLNRIPDIGPYPLLSGDIFQVGIESNEEAFNGKPLRAMSTASYGFFEPMEGWDVISLKRKGSKR